MKAEHEKVLETVKEFFDKLLEIIWVRGKDF